MENVRRMNRVYDLLENKKNLLSKALIDSKRVLTYFDFYTHVDDLSVTLDSVGIKKFHKVMYIGGNSIDFFVLFFALKKIGAIPILVNENITDSELDSILHSSLPNFIFTTSKSKLLLDAKFDKLENFKFAKINTTVDPSLQEEGIMLHTSGTSGKIKIAFLTDSNLLHGAALTKKNRNVSSNDVLYLILPATFVFGLNLSLGIIFSEACIYVSNKFSMSQLKDFKKYNISMVSFTPVGLVRLTTIMKEKKFNAKSIRYISYGGDSIKKEDHEFITDFFKLPLVNGYGMTETTATISINNGYEEGVGKIIDSLNLTFLKNDAFNNVEGVVHLSGPTIAKGYYTPQNGITPLSIDGWFNTGDYGYLTKNNDLVLMGREKDAITVKNTMLFPHTIERKIKEQLNIDVLVSQKNEEIVVLCLNVAEQLYPEILNILKKNYLIYECKFVKIKRIPVSYNGKIKRQELVNNVE
jgi:long-subunit acyl-CoA synthetase (AMP-forming)